MEEFLGLVFAGFALMGSPGPANLSLAAIGAAFGARRGLPYLAGIASGLVAVMAVTATGVTGLFQAIPGAAPLIGVLAAAYIVYLSFRIATAPPLKESDPSSRAPSFLNGIVLSLANPKGYGVMAALFPDSYWWKVTPR